MREKRTSLPKHFAVHFAVHSAVRAVLMLLLLLGGFAALGGIRAEASGEENVVDLMFLHDTHSHLNPFPTVEDGKTQVLGGFARIKTLIGEQLRKNPETLLVDAGDFSMGTLIQVIYEEEASELRMLGDLGMVATTLGNHEFDYNAEGLANMLQRALESGETLPALTVCNIDWEGMAAKGLTQEQILLKEAFEAYGMEDYICVERNGVRIAIVGVYGKDALACVPNSPLDFTDPIEAVSETVDRIQREEGEDVMLVCISHSGTWEEEEKSEDELLAKAVPELDVIVSGHTHTKLEEPIVHGDTYIVSAGEYGKYLGSLSLKEMEPGRFRLQEYELIPVEESIPADKDTQTKIDALAAMIDEKYLYRFGYTGDQVLCSNEVVFSANQDLERFHTEHNLGNIITDAYKYTVETLSNGEDKVDVAVVPSGVVRDTFALGEITTEQVFNVFSLGVGADGIPGYPLVKIYLTGRELMTMAEVDASISGLMPTARLYTSGIHWNFHPGRILLNRITDVYMCDDLNRGERAELEKDRLYSVVTDMYSYQMLGSVTDLSYGLLSVVPKYEDGTPVDKDESIILYHGDQEIKAWSAIAGYMASFEDTDGDGIGNIPARYAESEGRKVAEEGGSLWDLIKNPNKFSIAIVIIVILLLAIVIGVPVLIVKIIKRKKNRAK
ncbi:MAG: bifunctional metallophosphatase/5'-nucleotidase [Lachnospiraceae bacterium]|nr:bifunctional metallophosphatase/5'-nucleotidase [Lachnospiraceae bacterium]